MDNSQKALRYLQRQLSLGVDTLRSLSVDKETGRPLRTRNAWVLMKMRLEHFFDGARGAKRVVVMPGIRGVGKTTLISQMYTWVERSRGANKVNQLYIQLDEVVEKVGVSLAEVLDAYEELLGSSYEAVRVPTILYVDEIQSDENWPRIVKFITDRAPNVFFVCTGSSATQLQILRDADIVGRRGYLDKLYPLSFVEQQVLLGKDLPTPDLKKKIKTALYSSQSAEAVYQRLNLLAPFVNREWIKYDRNGIRNFLQSGGLPHIIFDPDIQSRTQFVNQMVDKVIESDMLAIGKFKSDTIPHIKRTIYVLAECDSISIDKLMGATGVKSRSTMYNILDTFIASELIIKVPAYGTQISEVRDPARYMFMSPAIRAGLFRVVGISSTDATRQGLLLEDYAALLYYRDFIKTGNAALSHPHSDKGGHADFILKLENSKQIAIEVGLSTKGFEQGEKTVAEKKCTYGLIIHDGPLQINGDKSVVKVPFDYFFLT